jgi:TrmH family RNA methyltransferase
VRSSTGSVFHLPVVAGSRPRHGDRPAAGGDRVAADVADGAVDLDELADSGGLVPRTAWLFGNEAHGLPPELLAAADAVVRVPIHGRAESLNLAMAATVCLYASAGQHDRERSAR